MQNPVSFFATNFRPDLKIKTGQNRWLAHRLLGLGLDVKRQYPLKVFDEDGTLLGDYEADLLVDDRLVVELKAVRTLADEHVAQLLGYLKSAKVEHGLLINFGAYKFQIRKYILSQNKVL